MAVLAWTMMGLALWHFTIFVDDRFWGGIVGAFVGALLGSIIFGFVVSGLSVPSREATDIGTTLLAVPGAALGLGVMWLWGSRREGARAQGGRAAH